MTFTKKKLAAVVSGSLLMGLASTAGAVVNLDTNSNATAADDVTADVASELNVASTGTKIDDTGTAGFIDIQAVLSSTVIPANSDVRITLTLGGTATFTTTAPSAAVGAINFGVISGGVGSNTVTFNANVGTADLAANQTATIQIGELTVTDQSDVTAAITVSRADNFGSASVKTIAASPFLRFRDSFAVAYTPRGTTISNIDVTNNSTIFTAGFTASTATADAGTSSVTYTAYNDFNGTAVAGSTITNSIVATVGGSNGLDAFTSTNGGSVAFGLIATTVSGTAAATAAQTFAAIATGTGAPHNVVFTVPAANAVAIQETPVSVTYAGTPSSSVTYNTASLNGSGNLSSLEKNGSQARLNFALTPNGAYPSFIRITNPSGIAGTVYVTLTNNDGTSSTPIDISAIAGVASSDLAAGASTALLNINDVYDAVVAANPTFTNVTTDAGNKLFVEVEAEFGTTGATSGVVVSAFTVSKDGNTFAMMTDASN